MLPEVEQLLILQDRDQKLRTLRNELKMLPFERTGLESRLAASGASLENARHKSRETEVELKKLELEAQSKRDAIARFRTQQFQTRKNEEFQALGNEIKRAGDDIGKIEDRELELMEQGEKMKRDLVETEKEFGRGKALIQQQLADLDSKTAAVEEQIKTIEADRDALAAKVEEELLNRYERLFASKGDAAVVALEHEVCMGCHMKLTTQTAVRVKGAKEIMNCEQCGRILYHLD